MLTIGIACYSSLIACILKVADPTRLFGEDVGFTLLLMYSLTFGAISMLLITERLLRYVAKVMVVYPQRAVTRRILYGVIYSHWFVAGKSKISELIS